MEIDMESQFQKLKDIINGVVGFYFEFTKEYTGPINPSSIVALRSSSGLIATNFLVLAEAVPASYLPYDFKPGHLEAVTVYLDDKFDFKYYNPETKELRQLSILVGDRDYSYDGTVNGSRAFFDNNKWTLKVLY